MSVGVFNAETNETKDVADKSRAAILDNELDENSNNAVKNKVIAQKIAELNQSIAELNTLLNGMDETLGGKLDVTKIANNLVTTEEGYALDARMGKEISSLLTNIKGYKILELLFSNATIISYEFDYNTINPGFYRLEGEEPRNKCVNGPSSENPTNCFFIYYKYGTQRGFQIILTGNNQHAWYRSIITDSDNWCEWKQI